MRNYYGAIEKYNSQDYIIDGKELNIDLLKPMVDNYFKNKIEYNQDDVNQSMCTIIAGAGILSNYYNYIYTEEELANMVEEARKDKPPFTDGKGWLIYKGVDLNRKRWNKKHPDKQVITYRVKIGSDKFYKLLEKGYHIQGGYRGNVLYNRDMLDDCKLNTVDYVKNPRYGHSVYFGMNNGKIYIIDSYKGRKCNVYEIVNFKEKRYKLFFKYGYVYIPKENVMNNELPKHIDPKVVSPKRRGIVLTWELEVSEAMKKGYKPTYNDYVNGNITDLITKMLIDLNNIRQGIK